MTRINIDTVEQETEPLERNRFKLIFDVHPNLNKVVVVKSLLAESNMVKVELKQ